LEKQRFEFDNMNQSILYVAIKTRMMKCYGPY